MGYPKEMNKHYEILQRNFNQSLVVGVASFDWEKASQKFYVGRSNVHKTNIGGRELYIEFRGGFNGPSWAVKMDVWVLGKDGNYYNEPSPSSRTDYFLELCRYETKEEALKELFNYERKNEGKDLPLYIREI